MPQSDNHDYELPNRGEPDWDVPLNDNFEDIDADVEIRDVSGNRGSYTPADGSKFLATDTGVVSVGDGSAWTPSLALSRFVESPDAGEAGNLVAGHPANSVASGVGGATIAGGGFDDGSFVQPNEVTLDFGAIGGGRENTAAYHATVGGGQNNEADAAHATIAGGIDNVATVNRSAIGGGINNAASGQSATVGGGAGNVASADNSTVGGGYGNSATVQQSTVGGGGSNAASGDSSTVGGGQNNEATAQFATIAGGGPSDTGAPSISSNVVYDQYGTIGGGGNNQAGTDDGDETTAEYATVGGGQSNEASGSNATVSGGEVNVASGHRATVSGGWNNVASGPQATVGGGVGNDATMGYATIGGGDSNEASGIFATVPGGANNTADGSYSFATGREADTNAHAGAVVFGDSSSTPITAQNDDEVRSQMPMYAPSFNSTSARAAKENVEPVDPENALAGVESLDISSWEFTDTDDGRHIGPMAEDFHDAFDVGDDEGSIPTVDADGVALAAIQGLAAELDERDERIEDLEATVAEQGRAIEQLRSPVDAPSPEPQPTDAEGI